MATLFQYPNAAPVAAGESYPSSTLNFYQPGTTTAITTYTTAALSVAHATTITADASGVFPPIYVDESVNASYRMIHKTAAGVTIKDIDSIPARTGPYPQTPVETGAGVTVVDVSYTVGHIYRYGRNPTPGTTDMTAAVLAASAVMDAYSGGEVIWPAGVIRCNTSVLWKDGVGFVGAGAGATIFAYYGNAEAIKSATPSTRLYNVAVRGMTIRDYGTGTIGLDLSAISSGVFEDVEIYGFDTAVRIHSPASGDAVFNRFRNVTANQCTTGYSLTGTSSNANVFDACRFNGASVSGTTGWSIADSNGNSIVNCHTDVAGTHVALTASTPGITDGNFICGNRIEGVTTGHSVGADVRHTHIGGNYYSTVTTRISDAGTDTIIYDPFWNTPGLKARFQTASAAGGHISYTREAAGGSSLPFMVLTDENAGSGTPRTLEINTERTTGSFIAGRIGGVTKFEAFASGNLTLAGKSTATQHIPTVVTFANADATPTVAGGDVFLTQGTTTITDFDDGVLGQTIRIKATGNITITHNASIIALAGAVNYVMTAEDTLVLTMFVDQVWTEVGRSVN